MAIGVDVNGMVVVEMMTTTIGTSVGGAELPDNYNYLQMISDEGMWSVNLYVNILLCGLMAVFGTFSNVVNIIVFYRLGLKSSSSVCLFALSFTDFLVSFDALMTRVFPIWNIFYHGEGVDPMAILHCTWVTDSLFLCSGWIVTLLCLERCVCVIMPFKVKQIFTRNRSIAAVLVIHVLVAATYLPVYCTHRLGWEEIGGKNDNSSRIYNNSNAVNGVVPSSIDAGVKRRMVVMFSDNRKEVEYYVEILSVTAIPVPSLVLTVGSVFWMVYGLHVSSRKRRAMSRSTSSIVKKKKDAEDDEDSKVSNKTRRLMKMVLFLAIICTLCSIPRTFATTIKNINPEINEGRKERNLSIFLWQLARFSYTVNASVNIFVYLSINSSYRAQVRVLFGLKAK